MEIPVKLEAFEGPLDLLLHLIDKNKINIYDIPIVTITDQYMAYLDAMEESDLDSMSEFLLMAATLLDIKCRMLLPSVPEEEEEEAEDPRAELVEQLQQYKMFKYISAELKDREQLTGELVTRGARIPDDMKGYVPPVDLDQILSDVTLHRLHTVFEDVLRATADKIDPIRSRFGKIEKEQISVADAIYRVRMFARGKKHMSFREMLSSGSSRLEVIVTFLAVLELMKTGDLKVRQEQLFDDIEIEVGEGLRNSDIPPVEEEAVRQESE